jgi:hypothetical protein
MWMSWWIQRIWLFQKRSLTIYEYYITIIRHGVDSSFMVYIYMVYLSIHTGQNVFYYSPCMQKSNQLNNRLIHGMYSQYELRNVISLFALKSRCKNWVVNAQSNLVIIIPCTHRCMDTNYWWVRVIVSKYLTYSRKLMPKRINTMNYVLSSFLWSKQSSIKN